MRWLGSRRGLGAHYVKCLTNIFSIEHLNLDNPPVEDINVNHAGGGVVQWDGLVSKSPRTIRTCRGVERAAERIAAPATIVDLQLSDLRRQLRLPLPFEQVLQFGGEGR